MHGKTGKIVRLTSRKKYTTCNSAPQPMCILASKLLDVYCLHNAEALSCLQVASHFTEALHHVREVLMAQPRFSFPHSPVIGRSTASLIGQMKTSTPRTTTGDKTRAFLTVPGSDKLALSSSGVGSSGSPVTGVALQNVDQITASLREMASRISQVMEVVSTLAQFRSAVDGLRGLPRVSGLWECSSVGGQTSLVEDNERDIPIPEGSVKASDYLEQVFGRNDYPLPPPPDDKNERDVQGKYMVNKKC